MPIKYFAITRNEILQAAQGEWRGKRINAAGLAHHANLVAQNLRDAWIGEQAEALLERVGERLRPTWERVFDRLYETDQSYLLSFDDADISGDNGAEVIAYSIAVLRWYEVKRHGCAASLAYFDEDEL